MPAPCQLLRLAVPAARSWVDDDAPSMGAAIAYCTVFSLAPLLVIVIAVAGAAFGREAVQGVVAQQLAGLVGAQAAQVVQALVAAASDRERGLVAGLLGLAVLVVGATTVFAQLQSSLDPIWKVPAHARPSGLMQGWEFLLYLLNIAVSLGLLAVLLGLIFKFMPTTPVAWRDVRVGALVTAVLFEIGKWGISLYLGTCGMDRSFQAAGSIIVLLAWVYDAAQVFLLGAEFTRTWAQSLGSLREASAAPAAPAAPVAPAR